MSIVSISFVLHVSICPPSLDWDLNGSDEERASHLTSTMCLLGRTTNRRAELVAFE